MVDWFEKGGLIVIETRRRRDKERRDEIFPNKHFFFVKLLRLLLSNQCGFQMKQKPIRGKKMTLYGEGLRVERMCGGMSFSQIQLPRTIPL